MSRTRTAVLAVLALLAGLLSVQFTGPAPRAAAAPAAFTHPGVLVSRGQLDHARSKVQAGQQPWKAAYDAMMASSYASLTRAAKPRPVVECGSSSNPNHGCTDERQDAIAAYTQALAWYFTRDSRYARKSIEIMDAWSATITDHTNSNAPLQTGWAGATWPRAAEIIKYTYDGGWPGAGRFATMLRDVYLPEVINGAATKNGNWELVMTEAALGISVFIEDRAAYDKAVVTYLARVPAYVYLTSDGDLPEPPPRSSIDTGAEIIKYWQGQDTFTDGLSQETCRDFGHTGWGIASLANIAETSRIQGQDLYPRIQDRLRHALGFHTSYENGTAVPSWLCGGSVDKGLGRVTEVGFNALHHRLGIAMSHTQKYTEARRPSGTDNYFNAWATLTHAGNPN
ncbi:alginate lyase family protein [Streptomyces deccanensis]|uniref:alginate lyase family protein n=1 Tax=Streptomyces deccanensis TaxID=424188 RepID=UPI001EFAD7DD|nr:alginate lyase family protein [Streptomyces deccanensis]ULR55445.1 alginate lyase family protein [Streptomyces deccanensis]